jgi:hypothetical protein
MKNCLSVPSLSNRGDTPSELYQKNYPVEVVVGIEALSAKHSPGKLLISVSTNPQQSKT